MGPASADEPDAAISADDYWPLSGWLIAFHLAALWGFAIVQPLLGLLGDTPEFFVARGNSDADMVVLALAVAFVPPVVLTAVDLLVRRVAPPVGRGFHLSLVGLLIGLIALPAVRDLAGAVVGLGLAGLLGAAGASIYARAGAVRSFATVLAAAPVLFVISFLFLSPASDLLLASETDARADAGDTSTPVVMIVFDELPTTSLIDGHGRIDARRFPAFGRLARDATWYRNATTVAGQTTDAVPALLSGRVPPPDALPVSSDYPRNVFSLLGDSHELHVIEPFTDLCPSRLCDEQRAPASTRLRDLASDLSVVSLHMLLPDNLRSGLPAVDRTWGSFNDDVAERDAGSWGTGDVLDVLADQDEVAQFRRFVADIQPAAGRPPLHFLHSSLPHAPWRMLPTGQQYSAPGSDFPGLEGDRWGHTRPLVDQSFERHVLQTGLADRQLGRTLRRLQETGLYDRALIVVTADHGVSFEPGEYRRGVTDGNVPELAAVPLIVKLPRQSRSAVDDRAARTIDIMPTIAAELGAGRNWDFDGVSLTGPAASRPVEIFRSGEPVVSLPLQELANRVASTARERKRTLRNIGAREERLYLAGPRPDLLGTRLSNLNVAPSTGRGELESPDAWSNVDPDAPLLPIAVAGTASRLAPGTAVALALNGEVVATTSAVASDGSSARFAALLPWTKLRKGPNRVVALAAAPAGVLRVLARSAVSRPYRIEDGGALRAPDGRSLPIDADAVTGFVDHASVDGAVVRLRGWASAALREPVDEVVAVADGRSVATVVPSIERPDVAEGYDQPDLLETGFLLSVPSSALTCSEPDRGLRLYGIAGDVAGPLEPVGDVTDGLASACQ